MRTVVVATERWGYSITDEPTNIVGRKGDTHELLGMEYGVFQQFHASLCTWACADDGKVGLAGQGQFDDALFQGDLIRIEQGIYEYRVRILLTP